jgi:23S rRNA (cytidine1920-2'-O)/16S rRNA (cytidine1409-2'-O)-methyltransferase
MRHGSQKQRLDVALVARGLVVSRARAKDVIARGEVKVAGVVATRTSMMVAAATVIELTPGAGDYISRGALKLRPALAAFGLAPAGRVALDVGASTGGFTEVLLDGGAAKVYAVDNGRDQLHARLRADPRVVSLEETDARRLDTTLVPEPIGAMVVDVSFISLRKVLPAALALAAPGCWLVALIKPQFEAEPGWVPKDGVITDADVHHTVVEAVRAWFDVQPGWQVLGTLASPLKGGDGNTEFLIGAVRHGD